ncbi:MAG: class I mannose-6-phosphate isomerase [Anaerolineae bacterium]|nr:class I mannose-6-phosphate isomerase [Anaerolineae bacterium]
MAVYPLRFEAALHTKVWGGRQLGARLGKALPSDEPYGESWELFWKNRATNGAHAGKTLGELIAADPVGMVGRAGASEEFPLLVKFIDAQEWLSVQVHPDDAQAQALENEPRGKTECWYIVDAAPGAQIAYGLSVPLDADGFRAAVHEGRAKDVMQYVSVAPGDFIYVPAGTMHAIGPGILLYELQQTSDTTYRVYDWDRVGLDGKPRDLHLGKALAVTAYSVNPPALRPVVEREETGYARAELIRGQYFGLDRLALRTGCELDTHMERPHALTAIQGNAEIRGKGFAPVPLPLGATAFVPAGVGQYTLAGSDAAVLCAWPE